VKIHEFSLVLSKEPDEAEADKIAGVVDDASIVTIAGVPQMWFHREATSLDVAIQSAVGDLKSLGIEIERLVIEGELLQAV
tara:strand:+ start:457 stop:699 length:243 start_codon:yes stop_codon:yes gene_type:complete